MCSLAEYNKKAFRSLSEDLMGMIGAEVVAIRAPIHFRAVLAQLESGRPSLRMAKHLGGDYTMGTNEQKQETNYLEPSLSIREMLSDMPDGFVIPDAMREEIIDDWRKAEQ